MADERHQCEGRTKSGDRCRRMIPTRHRFCPTHGDSEVDREQSVPEVLAEARRHEALALRNTGLSYVEIGDRLGVDRNTARGIVQRALSDLASDPLEVAELRALERSRLERMLTPMYVRAANMSDPDIEASKQALRIIDRLVKLNGLDAPIRHEHSGPDGRPIEVADVTPEFMADIGRELVRRGLLVIEGEIVEPDS
jgi:predicted DNA-binding protein (UPF0251 family)